MVVVTEDGLAAGDFLLNDKRKELFSLRFEGASTCLKSLMGDCLKRSATVHASSGFSAKRCGLEASTPECLRGSVVLAGLKTLLLVVLGVLKGWKRVVGVGGSNLGYLMQRGFSFAGLESALLKTLFINSLPSAVSANVES